MTIDFGFCRDDAHDWDNGRNYDGSARVNAARHCSQCSLVSLDYDDDDYDDDDETAEVES